MTEQIAQILITVVCSVFASSGFWAFLQAKNSKDSAERQMLMGLGHDRVVALGMEYIDRGYITKDEYENLHDYLYLPYKHLGGNGSAEHVMDAVKQLPVQSRKVD